MIARYANNAPTILFQYRKYLTQSERRFLGDISYYDRLTFAQHDVAKDIQRRARRRYLRGW